MHAPSLHPCPEQWPGSGAIVIAFSGGGDSVCLLHQLTILKLGRGLRAVHVDHGLDPDSVNRARRAVELATALGVECRVERVSVCRAGSLEANARQARYAALARHMQADGVLLTAHHADDVAETMLLRLLRGAGPGGLAGIPPERRFGHGWLLRPLLDWRRGEIMAHLAQHGLDWISDPANDLLALDRNFIRHQLMPVIEARFPGAVGAMNRSAKLNRSALASLNTLALADLAAAKRPGPRLDGDYLAALDTFRQAELLREWCVSEGQEPPPGAQLDEFLRQITSCSGDRQPELRWSGGRLRAWSRALWMDQPDGDAELPWCVNWDGVEPIALPVPSGIYSLHGSGRKVCQDWQLRSGTQGERIDLAGRGRRRLKDLLYAAGVPPWQRDRWPRLYRGDKLLALGTLWLDAEFEQELAAAGLQLSWESDLFQPPTRGARGPTPQSSVV